MPKNPNPEAGGVCGGVSTGNKEEVNSSDMGWLTPDH